MKYIKESFLPDSIIFLVPLLGVEDTVLICLIYANKYLYIPINPFNNKGIAKILSFKQVQLLSLNYKGQKIKLPCCRKIINAYRNDDIKKDYVVNNVHSLSKKYNLTPMQIRRILKDDS